MVRCPTHRVATNPPSGNAARSGASTRASGASWRSSALGILGYLAMGWSLSDALFMVVITISGVGYTEVHPLVTTSERTHTMLVIALGMVAVAYTLAGFIQLLTEGEIRRLLGHKRMRRQIEMLTGHTIIVGYGQVGALVGEELAAAELPFLVIDRAADRRPRDRAARVPLRRGRRDRGAGPARRGPETGPRARDGHAVRRRERLHHPDGPPDGPRRDDRGAGRAAEHSEEAAPGRCQPRRPARRDRRAPDRLAPDQPLGRRVRRAGHQAFEPGHRDGGHPDPSRTAR